MNPIPIKHSKELLKMPSSFPPRERIICNDQMDSFRERDTITTRADLNETTAPAPDKETKFPKILESIKVDLDLHVQQQYNGIPQYLYRNGLCKDIMLD